ncbi:MAG: DUF4349 domain-containing protein [Ruminococcus flavefaciens]|nr:DUF4349 domain-containing protein [Ruminococcus flavefaciens]
MNTYDAASADVTVGGIEIADAVDYDSVSSGAGITYVPEHGEKISYTYNYTAETTEYDKIYNIMLDTLNDIGGYIVSNNVYSTDYDHVTDDITYSVRRGDYYMKVPADKVNVLRDLLTSDDSNLYTENVYMQDRTSDYMDSKKHLESLQLEYDKLEELLQMATTVSEIIEVQDRLTDLNYEIQSYQNTMDAIDEDVLMSDVNLTLYEVIYYTATTREFVYNFGQRMADAFEEFLYTIPTYIFAMLFIITTVVLVCVIVFFVFKRIIKAMERKPRQHVITVVQSTEDFDDLK